MVYEERCEQVPVQVCKQVAYEQVVRVPRCVEKRTPVTYTLRVPRCVTYRVPIDPCTGADLAVPAPATTIAPVVPSTVVPQTAPVDPGVKPTLPYDDSSKPTPDKKKADATPRFEPRDGDKSKTSSDEDLDRRT
jgi:hypothetical protein